MHKAWVSSTRDGVEEQLSLALDWLEWKTIVARGSRVSIKPNLANPRPKPGVTTGSHLVECLIKTIRHRAAVINVVESDGGSSAWSAEEAFDSHGLLEICDRYGARAVNLTRDSRELVEATVGDQTVRIEMPRLLTRETDVFVTMPVPKLHAMTGVSLGFKNQWGCIPDPKRLRHHARFAHTVLAINKILRPALTIFDASYFLDGNGPVNGVPVRSDLLIAADHVGAATIVCCELMGIDPRTIPHLRLAIEIGLMPSIDAVELNTQIDRFKATPLKLRRTPMQWLALAAFRSSLATRLIYDSPLAGPVHELLYMLRGRPAEFSPKW